MKYLLYFLFIASFISCSNRREIVLDKIEDFRNNQTEWNNLTARILNSETANHKLGLYIEPEEFGSAIAEELIQKGIVSVTVGNSEDCKNVEYRKDWENSIGTQYLKWTTCDKIKTRKGYIQSDSGPIEVYGIGNGWLTWIDTDPI